ncbi:MAG: PKD domain-containing protein, partial [Bacteroidales bacterium]|nr:PKD domain-containing protein [Bacteroidales bacterium]
VWYLYDDQNNEIQQGSGYDYNTTYDIELDVDAGCYKFVMTDLDGFFFGYYSLTDGDNTILVETDGHFGNEEIIAFSLPIYEPTAIIDASTTVACIGGEILFFDASLGGPSSWSWTFEGGNPETSDEKNPVVSYEEPGSYDVTLEVSNSLGTDMISMDDYINVTSLSFGNLALEFDGFDDYVEVINESAFDFTDAMTLEVWIKPEILSGTQGILSKNFGNNAHPYQIRLLDDEIIFGFYSNTIGWQPIQTYNANLQTGEWTHIACTYNMQQAKIFVNGEQKAVASKNFEIPQNDQPFEIGRTKDVGYEYFSGTIDEVRVWDIALDTETIQLNMCTNYTGSTNEYLIAYFKFNECGGTLLTDTQNGNDGFLTGMTGEEWIESDACPSYNVNFIVTEEPGTVPVEEAKVNMSGTIRYTDETGEAVFEGYEEGNYNYSVSKYGYTMQSGAFDLIDEDVTIEIVLLINSTDQLLKDKVGIHPNPCDGLFIIKSDKFPASIEIYKTTGEKILDQQINQYESEISLLGYPKGIYFLKYEFSGKISTYKLITID